MANVLRELFIKVGITGNKDVVTGFRAIGRALKNLTGDWSVFKANLAANAVTGAFNAIIDSIRTAIRGIRNFFRESIELASVQEDAVTRLRNALTLTDQFSESRIQQMQNFASALQAVSTVGDEAALSGMSLAVAMGATAEQAMLATQAAADLSAATGKTFDTALQQTVKTLGGFAGELGETIPELKELTLEELRAGEGLELIAKRFDGFAKANTRTFSGALKQLQNAWGDLKEELGLPIIRELTIQFREQLRLLPKFVPIFQKIGRGVATLIRAFSQLFTRIADTGGLVKALDSITQFFVDAATIAESFFRWLAGEGAGTNFFARLFGQTGTLGNRLAILGEKLGEAIRPFITSIIKGFLGFGEEAPAQRAEDAFVGIRQREFRASPEFREPFGRSVASVERESRSLFRRLTGFRPEGGTVVNIQNMDVLTQETTEQALQQIDQAYEVVNSNVK